MPRRCNSPEHGAHTRFGAGRDADAPPDAGVVRRSVRSGGFIGTDIERKGRLMDQVANNNNGPSACIGACVVCSHAARLNNRICGSCLGRYGADFARTVGRMRRDRDFALACFAACTGQQRACFLAMFGDPRNEPWPLPPALRGKSKPQPGKVLDFGGTTRRVP